MSDRDIFEVEVNGKRLLMSGLAVRLAKFPVRVLSVHTSAEEEEGGGVVSTPPKDPRGDR